MESYGSDGGTTLMATNALHPQSNPIPAHTPMITVRGVTKAFDGKSVLRGIDLEVDAGEVLAIIGTSGCGKSTLLNIISGLIPPDEGTVSLGDPNFSLVFQYSALFDSLTVFDNVAFSLVEEPDVVKTRAGKKALRRPKVTPRELETLVREKLHLLGLNDIEHLYPNQLSGGMQKRVSFARAVVGNPRIILYDEPTAGLDPIASTMIEDDILKMRDQFDAASVVVTHQLSTIQRTADRVCLLHQGQVCWMGKPSELFTSDNPYARQFAQATIEGPMTDT
jgi:phospholipid/cholesterol/gamma-HCH transport system ATP-binding protein